MMNFVIIGRELAGLREGVRVQVLIVFAANYHVITA